MAFSRTSSLTERDVQPDARSSPKVVGRSVMHLSLDGGLRPARTERPRRAVASTYPPPARSGRAGGDPSAPGDQTVARRRTVSDSPAGTVTQAERSPP